MTTTTNIPSQLVIPPVASVTSSVVAALCTQVPIKIKGSAAYYAPAGASLVSELEAVDVDTTELEAVDMGVSSLSTVIPVSDELSSYDSDLVSYIAAQARAGFGKALDREAFSNDSKFTNNFQSVTTQATWNSSAPSDSILSAISTLLEQDISPTGIILSLAAQAALLKEKTTTGVPLYTFEAGSLTTIAGVTLGVFSGVPCGFATGVGAAIGSKKIYGVVGDFSAVYWGLDSSVDVQSFDSGTVGNINLITQRATALRLSQYAGLGVADPSKLILLTA